MLVKLLPGIIKSHCFTFSVQVRHFKSSILEFPLSCPILGPIFLKLSRILITTTSLKGEATVHPLTAHVGFRTLRRNSVFIFSDLKLSQAVLINFPEYESFSLTLAVRSMELKDKLRLWSCEKRRLSSQRQIEARSCDLPLNVCCGETHLR